MGECPLTIASWYRREVQRVVDLRRSVRTSGGKLSPESDDAMRCRSYCTCHWALYMYMYMYAVRSRLSISRLLDLLAIGPGVSSHKVTPSEQFRVLPLARRRDARAQSHKLGNTDSLDVQTLSCRWAARQAPREIQRMTVKRIEGPSHALLALDSQT